MVKFDNVTKLHYDKKRPAKVGNLIQQAVKAYDSGQVRFHPHAEDREVLRGINRAEAEQAMRSGRHIKKRDQYSY